MTLGLQERNDHEVDYCSSALPPADGCHGDPRHGDGFVSRGAFAEALNTDGTFVQTDNGQAADAAPADSADAQTSDSASADPAPDAGAADPTVLDNGDTPTPPASEIASAAGLTGAGQTESTPAGTLATDLVEGKELAEQQKQEETAEAEATWNEDLGLWMTSKGATA